MCQITDMRAASFLRTCMYNFLLSCIFLLSSGLQAQDRHFRIEALQGMNKIFVGESPNATRLGHSAATGISFKLKNRRSGISFEPLLVFTKNIYRLKINEDNTLKILQRGAALLPMAGLQISGNTCIKIGIMVQETYRTHLEVVYKNNSGYYSTGHSDLSRNFRPNRLQAGLLTGVSFSPGKNKRWQMNILIQQFVNSFMASDYLLEKYTFPGDYRSLFSSKSKATVLFIGINYRIEKRVRDKGGINKEETDE
jgi:hypothetical protein